MHTTRWWIAAALVGVACEQEIHVNPNKDANDVGGDTDPIAGALVPKIEVVPNQLDFGELPPDCPARPQVVTLTNVGEADLVVDALELKGPGNIAYTVSEVGPLTLAPEESAEVEVTFEAADYSEYDARITVKSNDPVRPTVKVLVDGAGSVAAFREQLFLQEQADSVDILWVLDTSCSMDAHLTTVANAMGNFIQSFVNLDLDYRMAVTTTDIPLDNGEFRGPWMDDTTSNIVAEFKNQMDAGAAGSNDEKGFRAARLALETHANTGYNADFVRDDATLAIVVVADEDDRDATSEGSGAQYPQVTDDFVAWLKSQKPDAGDVSFSGMVPPPGGSGLFVGANQYHRAINATRGVYQEIGTADVSPFITHLSFVAAGLEYRFELDEVPTNTTPSAIKVRVSDGKGGTVEVPFGVNDGWTYDAATNEIVLWGDAIPEPAQELHVRYPYDAGCGLP